MNPIYSEVPDVELLPCPLCGNAAEVEELGDVDSYYVSCTGCGLQQIAKYHAPDAVAAWNHRVALSAHLSPPAYADRAGVVMAVHVPTLSIGSEVKTPRRRGKGRISEINKDRGDAHVSYPIGSELCALSDILPWHSHRDNLGRAVRQAWVKWAKAQPNPKPSWLVPYDELSEPDKEVDRQIGEALSLYEAHGLSAEEVAAPALPSAREERLATEEAFWVCEMINCGSVPRYWSGGQIGWGYDIAEAMQFVRERDAKAFIRHDGNYLGGIAKATEHVMIAALASPAVAEEAEPVAWRLFDGPVGGWLFYQDKEDAPEDAKLEPLFTHSRPTPAAAVIEAHKLDTDKQVFFYEQDFYVLSNFSAFNLKWHGLVFPTSEHAYHWEKFAEDGYIPAREQLQDAILNAPSAHEAFKLAEAHRDRRLRSWDRVKVGIMRRILRAKADQHEYVRRKLLATGDRELVEDSWRDNFWGWGPNRDGQNMLGKLWMEVRSELREALSSAKQEGE